ncbi:MAG: hypothetical protein CM1200mP4_3680 [Rhodospirillaceae bacterium]|nr:MAG: hypothetical protein CM1200mP4_3680 [Rhodospirillaceae bacterium]
MINAGNPAAALSGSIRLQGARIDQIILEGYRESISRIVKHSFIFPRGFRKAIFCRVWLGCRGRGWCEITWTWYPLASEDSTFPRAPGSLNLGNGEGLRFERLIAIDDDYMFTVTDRVQNITDDPLLLYPYGLIRRTHEPPTLGFFILHKGPPWSFNGTLKEIDYDDLRDSRSESIETTGGWIGITDKYWLAALIPDQTTPMRGRFRYKEGLDGEKFQWSIGSLEKILVVDRVLR